MRNIKPVAIGISAFVYSLLTLQTALADDTEIYVPKDLPADQQVRPNILFILDSSGSMATDVEGTNPTRNRNRVMRSVVNNLIDQLKTAEDVNIGFMRFDGNHGGYVLSPVKRLTADNASSMKTVVNSIPASGNTPMLETYYESYLYMTGQNRVWGDKSVNDSLTGDKYLSPIEHSCQKSHIIYVTDGAPTEDRGSNSAVETLVTNKNTLYPASTCGPYNGQCLPHLAEYMANQDLFPAPAPFSDPTNRSQTVTSHFVGFAVDLPLLQNAAAAGGGKYYTSNNVSGLTDALKAIVVDITAANTSFAAPSVAVSAFNNLGFRNDLYYALFRPAEGANWAGNVKRYKLGKDGSGNPLIIDKNGNAAIDDSTGFFSNSASSFWSTADGSDVAKGGVAGRLLNPDSRKIFTWTAADRTPTAVAGVTGSQALDTSAHRLTTDNSAVTQAMLGASSSAQRTNFINWARGKKTDGSARLAIADVLHNEPKLVAYVTDEDLNRVANSPATSTEQLYMFFGSNEGFIHAIDPTTGDEKFAFIPKELLPNPGAYLTDVKGSSNKKYGMDGQINLWAEYRNETPADESAKKRTLNKAYLYAGMRRGGSNYYSLDVTDIDAPAFKWVIKGAYSNDPTPGFEDLGLTFSAPKLADVKINGTKTKVLIFTGGYDKDHDVVGTNVPENDDIGNSLFIVNADTGKLLWRASNTGARENTGDLDIATMTNSMPADPAIVDVNGDGLADIIYTADLRGQVFRFDIDNSNTGLSNTGAFAKGGRIASLGGATAADNRRFFSSPDVALIRERGGKTYFTISLGSGFRESPLNTDTNDRFYVLRDSNVRSSPGTYTTITHDDLVDVSSVDLSAEESAQVLTDIAALEAAIAALNQALSDAKSNFTTYKNDLGHTAKQNEATQAYSDANTKQRQIDEILGIAPYIVEHEPNTQQQSLLQASLTRANQVLTALEQARIDAQTLADETDYPALASAAGEADSYYIDAVDAYAQAKANSDSADLSAATALDSKDDSQASLQTLLDLKEARDQALTAWNDAANPPDPDPLKVAYDDAQAAFSTEESIKDQASRQAELDTATVEYNDASDLAASLSADTAIKLAEHDAALTAKDAAELAATNAQIDDTAAAALMTQRDRMALEYEKLVNLQASVDTAFAPILAKEDAIIAAKADPLFPSDDIPALETELETLRANYAAADEVAKRTELNEGTPPLAIANLDAVNAALSAGDATAIAAALDTALGDLETALDMPGTASLTPTELLDRALDEASKSTALAEKADNELTTTALLAQLDADRLALLATAAGLQTQADNLAETLYDPDSALLSPEQLAAAEAQVAPGDLTMFAAYQFLIDAALAAASDPETGLPYLRTQINNKYAELTPGNNYTPNTSLLAASKGFYLRLPKGEKVLSSSLSFRGAVLFSTFSPRGQAVSTCGSDVGRGRTYAISLTDASAIYTETVNGEKKPIRSVDLKRSGIPPTPSVILSDGKPTVLTGTEILEGDCEGAELCRSEPIKATYWREI